MLLSTCITLNVFLAANHCRPDSNNVRDIILALYLQATSKRKEPTSKNAVEASGHNFRLQNTELVTEESKQRDRLLLSRAKAPNYLLWQFKNLSLNRSISDIVCILSKCCNGIYKTCNSVVIYAESLVIWTYRSTSQNGVTLHMICSAIQFTVFVYISGRQSFTVRYHSSL